MAQPATPWPTAGQVLDGRYELVERVGAGGMATVFRGRDLKLGGREIAVKVLHPNLAAVRDARERLKREADAVACLHHDNVLTVHDVSEPTAAVSYIVMEFVEGRTLSELVRERRPGLAEVGAMIVHEVAAAAAHAHERRIIHRDIKPDNVIVRSDGVVKLTDFGIARALDATHLTLTGRLVGSPAHMAPEQIEGFETDYRADVFALGTVLYFCVTGALPFAARTPAAVMRRIVQGDYEPAESVDPAVGRELSAIIDRCLRVEPAERYANAGALRDALEQYLASVGIEDVRAELARWCARPDEAEETLRVRVVDELVARAEAALQAGKRPLALQLAGRAALLAPDDARAADLLERASSAPRPRWRALAWGGVVVLIAVVAIALVERLGAPPARSPRLALPVRARAVAPIALASVDPVRIARVLPRRLPLADPLARPAALRRRPYETGIAPAADGGADTHAARSASHRAASRGHGGAGAVTSAAPELGEQPAEVVRAVRVRIYVHPPPARLWVDGRAVPGNPGRPRSLELVPGEHEAVLRHPSCDVCAVTRHLFTVLPGREQQEFRFAVALLPARLRVDANVPATVWYGEPRPARTGQAVEVPMREPRGERRTIRVVGPPDYAPVKQQVVLRPGALTRVRVELHRASRR